jgi:hypothetical protein
VNGKELDVPVAAVVASSAAVVGSVAVVGAVVAEVVVGLTACVVVVQLLYA